MNLWKEVKVLMLLNCRDKCLSISHQGIRYVHFSYCIKSSLQIYFIIQKRKMLNPLMPGGNKKVNILKQTCRGKLKVCLSMRDLFVTTRH